MADSGGPDRRVIDDLRGVYSATVVDHVLNPPNVGGMAGADGFASLSTAGGDTVRVWLRVKADRVVGDRVVEARFETDSCAATTACTSVVTELVTGKTVAEAHAIGRQEVLDALGGLPEGNVHCAEHAVAALKAALKDYLVVKREPWKRNYRAR
ncbi:MAG: iron-sulfur cluster assembly scaffold protein [Dehalococcoidales bacterium]